jgi:hypothetical protein
MLDLARTISRAIARRRGGESTHWRMGNTDVSSHSELRNEAERRRE